MPEETLKVIFIRKFHNPSTYEPMRMDEVIDGAFELNSDDYKQQLFLYQNSKKEIKNEMV
jgi:hypothetical protein